MEAEQTQVRVPTISLKWRLKIARDEAGFEQAELADQIGVSRRSIVSYEKGDTEPKRPVVLSWALATGYDVNWLMSGEVVGNGPTDPSEQVDRPFPCMAEVVPLRPVRPEMRHVTGSEQPLPAAA